MKRNKWIILTLVVLMTLSLALAGCGKTEEPPKDNTGDTGTDVTEETGEQLADEQVLRLNWGAEPPDLDPQTTTDTVSFEVVSSTLEGLVRLQPDGSVQQGSGMAESWTVSEDALTYNFKIRDAKWSDGTPVTAHDFEFAWKRAMDPATASQYSYQFYHIKNAQPYIDGEATDPSALGVKALDDKTLEVVLERPTPFFLSLTSFITYIPAQKAAVESFGDEYASAPDKMVYSGPFVVSEWQHEQKLVLEKNPNYWDAENVKLDRIEGDMITDNNTTVNLYETGELDVIAVPAEFLEKYHGVPEYGMAADATTWYLQFNTEDEFFSNLNIRKAFIYGTDVKGYVDNVLNDGSLVAGGLTPPGMPGKAGGDFAEQRTSTMPTFDKAKAVEHLELGLTELGKTKEELAKHVFLLTGEGTWWSRTGQAFQQMWKDNLGIEMPIEAVSFALRLDRYNKRDYSISIAGWGGDYNDPMTFMDMFVTDGGNNDAYYANAEYDAAIQTGTLGTGDERIDAMLQAEALLARDLPILPLFHPARDFVERTYVKGHVRFPVGVSNEYKWIYILKH